MKAVVSTGMSSRPAGSAASIDSMLFGLCLLMAAGCQQADDDDHHHLEHVIPAHKPQNFRQAVTELRTRGEQFFGGDIEQSDRQELQDIVDWLPEIAADSDLRRKPWEEVQQTTLRLNQLLNPQTAGGGKTPQTAWQEQILRLEKLVPLAEASHND